MCVSIKINDEVQKDYRAHLLLLLCIHARHMSVVLTYVCGIKGVTFNHRNRLCMLELMLQV